jgi:hypothetical protein
MEGFQGLGIPQTITNGIRFFLKNSFIHAVQEVEADGRDDRKAHTRSRSSPPRLASNQDVKSLETTLMIRNIPTKFSQRSLLEELSVSFDISLIDFFYLPIDFKTEKNLGYAFINFTSSEALKIFHSKFKESRLSKKSPKVLSLTLAKVQGLDRNYNLFKSSSVMTVAPPHFRPMRKCGICETLSPLTPQGTSMCHLC